VTSAYLLPLLRDGAPHGYVALIDGRATGRRSVLAVLSPDLRVLHAELLERRGQLGDNLLCAQPAANPPSSEAALVTCAGYRWCNDQGGILLRLKD